MSGNQKETANKLEKKEQEGEAGDNEEQEEELTLESIIDDFF